MMNAMLINSGMPDNMWGEAILTACYILNKVPHKRLDKTPYEMWKGHPPNLKFLQMWGCLAKVGIPNFKVSNIGAKTFDAIFIGYAHNNAAYRFLCLNDNSVIESRDAKNFENVFPFKKLDSTSKNDVSKLHAVDSNNSKNNEPRRSKRQRTETSFGPDFIIAFLTEIVNVDILSEELIYSYMLEEDPRTYEEAIKSMDSNFWKEAIKSEIDSIMSNHTWELVDLPKGSKPIDSKWIFKRKLRPDGSIEKFKARLVIKGYTQRKGIDFFDTYSPVTKISTVHALIALAIIHNLIIHQMDVKIAFLNGELNEEMYMK